ncbi:MAG: amidohydrolase family protein [Bdellovibrionales bacterium]|nr:amidohydrolase family protein [Bdellovibrionales bacterium]
MRYAFCTLALSLVIVSCTHSGHQDAAPEKQAGSRAPAGGKKWVLAGYLPEAPDVKAYVTIEGNRILSVLDKKPAGEFLDTESWIFPGLIDLHNHIKYNVLPLWSDAKGQFNNRYEWRKNYAPYKTAVDGNMDAYDNGLCETIEWGEFKALAGGTTSIQGIGGVKERDCAKGKLVRNIEIQGDIAPGIEVMSTLDLIFPDTYENAYQPYFQETLSKIGKQAPFWSPQKDEAFEREYAKLFKEFLEKTGVARWLATLLDPTKRDMATVAELLFGPGTPGFSGPLTDANIQKHAAALDQALETYLVKTAKVTAPDARKRLKGFYQADFIKWLTTYAKLDVNAIKSLDIALDNRDIQSLLGSKAVLVFKPGVAKYAAQFEPLRKRVSTEANPKLMKEGKSFGVIVHLAEGRTDDSYNRLEFQMAHELNLVRPGMVFIHATGIVGPKEYKALSASGSSIVWSPFSNLLLYNETTDVVNALKQGVNVALGSDWSPTGSRNLLGEMKIAKAYLKQIGAFGPGKLFNDEVLVSMVTRRPARMINLEKELGVIRSGAIADIIIVERKTSKNPWQDLVEATEKEIQLVIVGGFPTLGDSLLMQPVPGAVEVPMAADSTCGFSKKFAWNAQVYGTAAEKVREQLPPSEVHEKLYALRGAFAKATAKDPRKKGFVVAPIDALFTCEDQTYTDYVKAFIPKQVSSQIKVRDSIRADGIKRKNFKSAVWSATASPAFGEE